jgi:hypothetical protein
MTTLLEAIAETTTEQSKVKALSAIHLAVHRLTGQSPLRETAQSVTNSEESKKGCAGCSDKTTTLQRKSCLKCVEKHIGAAEVKAIEILVGYDYKLMVIGHLNEAEEESITEYPALAALIRDARLALQDTGSFDLTAAKALLGELVNDRAEQL